MRDKLRHIRAWFCKNITDKICLNIVLFSVVVAAIPIPERWNKIVDEQGGKIGDYIWYNSYYLIITILLFMACKNSRLFGFKMLFILSFGKLADQLWHPYGLGPGEIVTIILVASWSIHKGIKCIAE